jgi:hypothetical protein
MKYYTIQNNGLCIANTEQALTCFYDNVFPLPVDYEEGKYIVTDGKLILNPDWENEQAEKERVRLANLHLTRGDVFRGLLLAKGVTREDIRTLIEAMPEDTPQEKINKEMALIDFDEALEFYRGVALIDTIGIKLGISAKQLDKFFDTKNWQKLVDEED